MPSTCLRMWPHCGSDTRPWNVTRYIPAARDTKKEGPEAPVRIEKATSLRKNTGPQ